MSNIKMQLISKIESIFTSDLAQINGAWLTWIFNQYQISPGSRILELGCGPGRLWLVNSQRLREDWHIMLSDFSPGMVEEAQKNLGELKGPIRFEVNDVDAAVAYDLSTTSDKLEECKLEVRAAIRQEIETNGYWHILKRIGFIHRLLNTWIIPK